MDTDINLSKNNALDAEVIKKKMNKSLLFELFIAFVPPVVSIICAAAAMFAGANKDELAIIFVIIFILSMIICLIIRIRAALNAMNCCMDYFTEKSDTEFVRKCSTSKTWYIISIIMPFLPILNIFTIVVAIYNLIIWLSVKDRIRVIEYVKTVPSRDIRTYSSSTGKYILIAFLIVVGFGFIGLFTVGLMSAAAIPAYSKYMARARFSEVINAVGAFKKEVELCIFSTAPTFTPNSVITSRDCSNIHGAASGPGYKIRDAGEYESTYVAFLAVDNGTIIATAKDVGGLAGATYILVPYFTNNGMIDWKRSDFSTCIENDLC